MMSDLFGLTVEKWLKSDFKKRNSRRKIILSKCQVVDCDAEMMCVDAMSTFDF